MSDEETRAALIDEATRKSGLVWLTLPGVPQPRAAWHLWHDGAAYVVCGGIEQPLPGLVDATRVAVTVRSKETGGRLVTWIGEVSRVRPGTPLWDEVVAKLHLDRLNAPDGADQPARWARDSAVMRLVPTGQVVDAPGSMPDGSQAARPVPTPATRARRRPFMIGARRRPADR